MFAQSSLNGMCCLKICLRIRSLHEPFDLCLLNRYIFTADTALCAQYIGREETSSLGVL